MPSARPGPFRPSRRGVLGTVAAGLAMTACGRDRGPSQSAPEGAMPYAYGSEKSQFAELRMPSHDPLGTVVLLHGGYWYPQYGLELMRPLADRLNQLGFATWNVEYRRTGDGGGVPATLEDVAAAMDRLGGTGLPDGLSNKVVLLGHSAGGHLAMWVASRTDLTPGGAPKFPLSGAISLSGVLNLTLAATDPRSSDPVTAFLGGTPVEVPERYALADPTLLVPASCRVWAAQAEDDGVVSADQSTSYVAAARAADGRAERVDLPGDHFAIIDPRSAAFATIQQLLNEAAD